MASRSVQLSGPGNNCGSQPMPGSTDAHKVAVTIPVPAKGGMHPGFKQPKMSEPWLGMMQWDSYDTAFLPYFAGSKHD